MSVTTSIAALMCFVQQNLDRQKFLEIRGVVVVFHLIRSQHHHHRRTENGAP